ncbi:MAG: iron ABC transporter permease [Thermoanaerobaculia bacterium]|nr:iron ABC transporter permease [Thermoanaerobaculia bacterium]MBP9825479.1 iron ABC transporter permease [Thermoanaerobaculia bacterium]
MSTAARRWWLGAGVFLVLAWLVGYPLLVTTFAAFTPEAGVTAGSGGGAAVSAPFAEFVNRPDEWTALYRSLWISLASVALAGLVGVPLGFLFARAEFPGRRVLGELLALPVALPPLVGVIAFLYLYGESGMATRLVGSLVGSSGAPWRLTGPGAILLVHTYSMYVYFYLFTRAALARFDGAQLEAAASLGAGRWRTLTRVVLPGLAPALAAAAILTFLTALGSFSAPYIFGGSFRVMTTQILASRQNGDVDIAEVETFFLIAVAIAGLLVARTLERRHLGRRAATQRGTPPERRVVRSPAARIALTAAGWLLALLLLLPHLTLILISFVPRASWTTELFPPVLSLANYRSLGATAEALRPVANSLWMALAATAGALALGFVAARRAVDRRPGGAFWSRAIGLLIAVPWAVPATAFAVALATTMSVQSPASGRFLLVGTAAILPLAYLVRALPATGQAAIAALEQMDPQLEEASAALGAGKLRTLVRVTLPRVRPALAAGASLAFLAAFGDFVVSIVLYTYETRPISIEILSNLRLQETGVAAVYGVLLTALSAAAFLLWGREKEVR